MCTFALLKPTRWPHGWSGYSFTSCPGFWLWSVLNFSQISTRKLKFFYSFLKINSNYILKAWIRAKSSLSIFLSIFINVKILRYFILQNNFFRIYEDSFGAKILRDDCTLKSCHLFYKKFFKNIFYLHNQIFPTHMLWLYCIKCIKYTNVVISSNPATES